MAANKSRTETGRVSRSGSQPALGSALQKLSTFRTTPISYATKARCHPLILCLRGQDRDGIPSEIWLVRFDRADLSSGKRIRESDARAAEIETGITLESPILDIEENQYANQNDRHGKANVFFELFVDRVIDEQKFSRPCARNV